MVSRWGNDAPEYRVPSAKMLITFLLTMRATPIFYNGDELGMINIKFENIEDYRDIETVTMYQNIQSKGGDLKRFLKDQQASARDNSRTPFQWDATENAGFTCGTPWIKINSDYLFINEEAQNADRNSILSYFRCLAQLRNNRQVFIYGHYTLYDEAHGQVYAYTRIWGKEGLLVILNFSKELVEYNIPAPLSVRQKPIVNSETVLQMKERTITLLPYQALVFELAP
jgi:oligo-1,6-glucosidase